MYLKSLELQGFKSFPDRTTIRFSDGMTAIVGPNGSGKSNISDAIRWVLGEQSTKSLRGAKMEDVIFGGTAKRSPTGFAQVSLLLDNSVGQFPVDATEVMVTRKYYRSGESEYFINRKRVRLRDVREVFMDTGLGHDGYSMIGQGRIDEILAVKSADRREVFEEAAGVTRFRTRKEEAERKLDQTAENLIRIRDIWNELDARSEPLRKQSESAQEYMQLRDKLRLHEISLWMDTLDGMKDIRKQSEADRKQAEHKLTQAKQDQQNFYDRSEQVSDRLRNMDVQADAIQQELNRSEEAAAEMTRRIAVLEESCRNASQNIGLAKGQLAAQQEQQEQLTQQITAREHRLHDVEQELKQTAEQLDALNQQIKTVNQQIDGGEQYTQQLREQAESAGERVFAVQADRRAALAQLESMNDSDDEENIRAASERTQQEELAQQEMQCQMDALRKQISNAEAQLEQQQLQQRQAQEQLQAARQEHAALTAALTDSKNRVRMLEELQRDYEGFSRAVKLVMQQAGAGRLRGIRGPLSSLIQVSDHYVTAIETALGAAASNIIAERAEDGRDAIAMLKKRDGGRATFLPMDTIRPQSLRETGLERSRGFCGIAADLVECEADYRDIVENALGRTVVADTMDDALAMSRQFRNRFRIVTLDGQVINAGGSMTGGSTGRSSGILSRANQLEQLKQRMDTQQKKLSELEQHGRELAEQAQTIIKQTEQAQQNTAQLRQQLAALSAQAQQHQLLLENIRQTEQQLRDDRKAVEQQREQLKAQIGRLERNTAELARERQQALTALNKAAGQAQQSAQQLDELNQQAAQLRTQMAQASTEQETVGQALRDLRRMQENTQEAQRAHQDRIQEYEHAVAQAETELAQLEQQSEQAAQHREQLREQLKQCGQQRMQLEQDRTKTEKQAREMGNDIIRLERLFNDAQHAEQRVRQEEQQILDRMWENYELTPTAARPLVHPVTDRPEEERQAAALRKSIKALGAVNLAAVEEYEQLSERLTFLTEQKNDLETAEAELRGIIDKLTEQMRDIFAASFAQLNQYFGETFTEIFGGGSAELRLEDESDILGCGIEIRVTPPGKTVKTLSLLSGGEKAFVAIALYFAILKVRPTPFCVLDEIEAALDDVNVTRFAQYLQKLSDKTQFIVITHRRGTMEEADMLYGVTMQERGVSKLLMLNISEVEQQMHMELK